MKRDSEIEEFIESHSEVKFKANKDLKRKFQLKKAFAAISTPSSRKIELIQI
jgi:hypothetical protein